MKPAGDSEPRKQIVLLCVLACAIHVYLAAAFLVFSNAFTGKSTFEGITVLMLCVVPLFIFVGPGLFLGAHRLWIRDHLAFSLCALIIAISPLAWSIWFYVTKVF